jgi:4-diphosphocytidyl-2C-methyl-D-erythritol kinase
MDDNAGQVDMLMSLQEMINSNISAIERLESEMKKFADMLNAIFENDPTYQEHAKQAKEAAAVKGKTRQQLMKMANAIDLDGKVKSLKQQIKETKNGLSDYLQEYARISGSNTFEDASGRVNKIVYVAKLVKE